MNFLTLRDPLLSVLFENADILAIDKPYGIDSHTNEAKAGQEAQVVPGLIELFERQLSARFAKLHIVHRLDKTTTGVIVFAKTLEAAKTYQGFFRNREAKKTYLFLTDRRSPHAEFSSESPILHKGSELAAKTEFKRLAQGAKFDLWQAKPSTGRKHQIRIHASELGIALLGDTLYGGTPYPFICLHDRRIEFPNGVSLESRPPVYYERPELLDDCELAKALLQIDRRRRLYASATSGALTGIQATGDLQCLRLVNARRESEDGGFTLDQLGEVLVLTWYKDSWTERDRETIRRLSAELGQAILVRYMSARFKDQPGGVRQSWHTQEGESAEHSASVREWSASEGDLKYALGRESGLSPAPDLDLRLQRRWVQENTKGKSVMTLFAHTCGFSAAAAKGGAREVTSVELNKTALNWGRVNFEVNDLPMGEVRFLFRECSSYLDQCRAKGVKFDLIICNPPAFWRWEKKTFKLETSLAPLLRGALGCLNEGGELLFSTRAETLSVDDIRRAVIKAQSELQLRKLEISAIQPSLDFDLPGERPSVKSFLIRRANNGVR